VFRSRSQGGLRRSASRAESCAEIVGRHRLEDTGTSVAERCSRLGNDGRRIGVPLLLTDVFGSVRTPGQHRAGEAFGHGHDPHAGWCSSDGGPHAVGRLAHYRRRRSGQSGGVQPGLAHPRAGDPSPDQQRQGRSASFRSGRQVTETGSLGEASNTCAAGTGEGIKSGAVAWTTVTLAPGRYELVCNLRNNSRTGCTRNWTLSDGPGVAALLMTTDAVGVGRAGNVAARLMGSDGAFINESDILMGRRRNRRLLVRRTSSRPEVAQRA